MRIFGVDDTRAQMMGVFFFIVWARMCRNQYAKERALPWWEQPDLGGES